MDDSLKDSWQPKGPISKKIRERIQKAGKRFHSNDNISEFIQAIDTPEIRDDRSIGSKSSVSIGASKHLEEAMVASSKSERADGTAPVTRICLTGGPCAGKTTAMSAL